MSKRSASQDKVTSKAKKTKRANTNVSTEAMTAAVINALDLFDNIEEMNQLSDFEYQELKIERFLNVFQALLDNKAEFRRHDTLYEAVAAKLREPMIMSHLQCRIMYSKLFDVDLDKVNEMWLQS